MVSCPDQFLWECVKKNNSFLRKKNGHTKRSGKIAFSIEKGNLKSLNQLKYSGLANTKVVDIVCTPDHKTSLIQKVASKASTKPAQGTTVTNVRKDYQHSIKTLRKVVVDNYYRPDLSLPMVQKYTAVYQANRRSRGILKTIPVKKGRAVLK